MVFDAPLYDSAWQEKLPTAGVYGGLFFVTMGSSRSVFSIVVMARS